MWACRKSIFLELSFSPYEVYTVPIIKQKFCMCIKSLKSTTKHVWLQQITYSFLPSKLLVLLNLLYLRHSVQVTYWTGFSYNVSTNHVPLTSLGVKCSVSNDNFLPNFHKHTVCPNVFQVSIVVILLFAESVHGAKRNSYSVLYNTHSIAVFTLLLDTFKNQSSSHYKFLLLSYS